MTLAVGFFDGVHLGHRKILASADAALTFAEHPRAVLAPDRAPALLMTSAERRTALADALGGAVRVRVLDFTPELAAEPAADFVTRLRTLYPDLTAVRCGANWNFGAGGRGNADFLRARGVAVEVVPYAEYAGEPVSSTRIRAALRAGDLASAAAMLGRPYAVAGAIRPGKGVGRALGFPTLNLRPDNPHLPRLLPFGVYAASTPWGRAAANWGRAPTMGPDAWPEPVLEVHLLTDAPAAVPDTLAVTLERFLRPERTFASRAELTEQIARDCAQIA